FLLEGVPAILLGIVVLFALTDRPQQAGWLPADECEYITTQLRNDSVPHTHLPTNWSVLLQPSLVLLIVSSFLHFPALFGLIYSLPTLLKRASGLPNLTVTFLVSIPYFFSLISQVSNGWHSDRTGERRWHAAVPALLAGSALAILPMRALTLP